MSASVSGAYASAHLPECVLPKGWGDCICDQIRACEERVRDEYVDTFVWADGKRVGLQAARDAVETLHGLILVGGSAERMWREALAAIDALKGMSE